MVSVTVQFSVRLERVGGDHSVVHSNHDSDVGGLAPCYLGSSAPAATARFRFFSFRGEKTAAI